MCARSWERRGVAIVPRGVHRRRQRRRHYEVPVLGLYVRYRVDLKAEDKFRFVKIRTEDKLAGTHHPVFYQLLRTV